MDKTRKYWLKKILKELKSIEPIKPIEQPYVRISIKALKENKAI